MMNWNYRVIVEDDCYTVREVFYNEDRSIVACADKPLELSGESLEELVTLLKELKEALKSPILTVAELPDIPKAQTTIQRGTSLENLRRELGLEALEVRSSEA